MPCEAITRGGLTCTRNRAEIIVWKDQTLTVCGTHRTTFWEYVEEFGIETAIQRIREGRQACTTISWTVPTSTSLATNSTRAGSSRPGSR